MTNSDPSQARAQKILTELARLYPDARPALVFSSPFELLVAVILSAQCTDIKVNSVTPALFERWPDAAHLAAADPQEVEEVIRVCGLFHTKAKNLVAMAGILVSRYGGQVPETREALEALPGVGRKTASVVLSNAFGQCAIAVDTHVFRVSNRLSLARAKDVLSCEQQLMDIIPRELWGQAHHWLIFHGRQVCHARKPECQRCTLSSLCPSASLPEVPPDNG